MLFTWCYLFSKLFISFSNFRLYLLDDTLSCYFFFKSKYLIIVIIHNNLEKQAHKLYKLFRQILNLSSSIQAIVRLIKGNDWRKSRIVLLKVSTSYKISIFLKVACNGWLKDILNGWEMSLCQSSDQYDMMIDECR